MRLYWKRKAKDWLYLFSILLFVAGILYPLIANFIYERRQDTIITAYDAGLENSGQAALQREWEACRSYNDVLRQTSVVMTGERATGEEAKQQKAAYEERLNVTGNAVMGYLQIPKIGLELPVYHHATEDVLANALGHLPETSLPVGGTSTHAAITGHSGVSDKRLFTDLEEMERGDLFYFHVLGKILCYQVDRILVVKPEETEWLVMEEGRDDMTLITCTPFGINDHRLLVRGRRVEMPDEDRTEMVPPRQQEEGGGMTWYMEYGKAVGTGLILFVLIRLLGYISAILMRRWENGRKKRRKVVRSAKDKSRKMPGSGKNRG